MELKKLEVPTASITDVKKSPMDVFAQAREEGTGVYIFNREKVAGVMITREQYELLLTALNEEERPVLDEVHQLAEPIHTLEQVHEAVVNYSHPLENELRAELPMMKFIPLRSLDELMIDLGFITKKTGFGSIAQITNELERTVKLRYRLRQKEENKTIVADIIGVNEPETGDVIEIRQVYVSELD
jgi:PHD/YefM family antitoxin component YafN of YafNO toxin-antitoxin module